MLRSAARAGDVIGKVRRRRFLFDSDVLAKLTGSAWYDTRKAERELGVVPKWDLESALPEIVEGRGIKGGGRPETGEREKEGLRF
jgi:nucleoside-diphosphate-sugar epimerase